MNESGLSHIEDKAKNATWEDDFFGRKPYADKLTQLVKNTKNPYVIALSAEWGNGKTFFLNAWRNSILPEVQKEQQHNNSVRQDIKANCSDKFLLKENEIPCVYIDAWALEDLEDPLLAVCYEIQEQLNVYLPENDKKLLESALNFINFKNIIKIGGGVLSDLTKDKLKNTTKEITTILSDSISKHKKNDNAETNFFNSVKEIVNTIQEKTRINSILIMIDELDRCNPEYIIKLLERIKNLFNIPGLVFVLAVNDEMLNFAVRKKFNENEKLVKNYLDKFINLSIKLPAPDFYNYIIYHLENDLDFKQLALGLTKEDIEFWEKKFLGLNLYEKTFNEEFLKDNISTVFERSKLEVIKCNKFISYVLQNNLSIITICMFSFFHNISLITIREYERIINKFIIICLSNKFNVLEMLMCLEIILSEVGLYIKNIPNYKNTINYSFMIYWYEILDFSFLFQNIMNLYEYKNDSIFKQIINVDSYELESKIFIETREEFNNDLFCIVEQFIKERGRQTKEQLEEKIRLAINFYEFTEENKDNNNLSTDNVNPELSE